MNFFHYRYGDQLKVGNDYWVTWGNEHAGKLVAYPRRIFADGEYKKFDFQESYLEMIKPYFHRYAQNLQYISQYCTDFFTVSKFSKYYKPEEGAKKLLNSNKPAAEHFRALVEIIKECGVKERQIGLSGSFLIGLDNQNSDFDTFIYNSNQSKLALKLAEEFANRGLLMTDFSRLSLLTRKRFYKVYGRQIRETSKRFIKQGRSIFEGNLPAKRFTLVSGFPREISIKPKLQQPLKFVSKLEGEIIDDSQCMPRPSIYVIECGLEKPVELISFSRAYCLYRNGDKVKLTGLLSEHKNMFRLSIIWPRDGSVETVRLNL